jgi:hypothetical protein
MRHVRFSNRPFGVKHFQTLRRCGVDVTHGLVLLFGIGTRALPSWDSKTRWSNLLIGLTVTNGRSKRTCELTSSIVPRGTSFHRWVEFEFPPIAFDPAQYSCRCSCLLSALGNAIFRGRDKGAKTAREIQFDSLQRQNAHTNPRQFGAIRNEPGNLCL